VTDIADPLGVLQMARDNEQAARAYAALQTSGKLRDHRMITYRCKRGCLLFDLVHVSAQMVAHHPRYRLSPRLNASTSSESGRAANTVDGDRRWKAQTYDVRYALNFTLACDHMRSIILERSDVQDDMDAGHAAMVVDPDGGRCPA